jgi:hypothetical protein
LRRPFVPNEEKRVTAPPALMAVLRLTAVLALLSLEEVCGVEEQFRNVPFMSLLELPAEDDAHRVESETQVAAPHDDAVVETAPAPAGGESLSSLSLLELDTDPRTNTDAAPRQRTLDSLSLLEYNPELSPPLSPESHDKFFDHDYPDDQRVEMHKGFNFQHPYPVMQDSEDYDKDYVKDENSDGGQWKAQEVYDQLRAKKSAKVLAAKRAWSAEADLEKALEEAKAKRAAAEEAAKKAADKAADAKSAAAGAESNAKALSSGSAMQEEMDTSVKEVETDVTTLEDCKKKLAEAKEHLKVLMKEKEDHEGARAVEAEQAQAKALTAKDSAEALANSAAEKSAAAADLTAKGPEEDSALDKKIGEAKAKAEAAEEEASKGQSELRAAAIHLRGVRHSEVDDDGGVYYMTPAPPARAPLPPAPRPTLPPPAPPTKSSALATRAPLLFAPFLLLAHALATALP